MKKKISFILAFLMLASGTRFIFYNRPNKTFIPSVTYTFSGGRFGDNLIAWLRAEWISYRLGYPIIYQPFKYSDQLSINHKHNPLNLESKDLKKIFYNNHICFKKQVKKPTLYVIPYFPEVHSEVDIRHDYPFFQVDWKNPSFRQIIKNKLKLRNKIKPISFPEGYEKIALHVRTGKGYDNEEVKKMDPEKFPPLQFYSNELKKLAKYLQKNQLFVHVFTDDSDPESLVNEIKKQVAINQIVFSYHSPKKSSVIQDFFQMFEFDYLIHPTSNFSIVPSLLNDYRISICPKKITYENNIVRIDQVEWKFN